MVQALLSLFWFAFPDIRAFFPQPTRKRTVHVKRHRRNGVSVRKYTREISVPAAPPTSFDPYAYLGQDLGEPVIQQSVLMDVDEEYFSRRRHIDQLRLPHNARIVSAPRFATEYIVWDGNKCTSVVAQTNGDIEVDEIEYKRPRRL